MTTNDGKASSNFIRNIIDDDLAANKNDGRVVTRFPPEPNGYLHIGHAKSICLNFGIARDYDGGACHLRFDDTNPEKEDVEYAEAIKADVKWLGFDWKEHLYHASDYFQRLHDFAVKLIEDGKAYVCNLSADEMREYRGTLTEPGKESPYRNRSAEENLDLFRRMKEGEFEEGTHVLRAKIDMASPNIVLRDPAIYRIRKVEHQRTGSDWCIYPMYDFTHCLSDSIEGITHSLCSLEFQNNRPLYDWFLDELGTACHPQQIEFARLNLDHTVMSKRKLMRLVESGAVRGWDDPRMPTIAGLRRRGYTPEAIRNFAEAIGVGKSEGWVSMALLENCIREDLNERAPRVMGVLRPLKVVIENYPEDLVEEMEVANHPQKPEMGVRKVPFSRELFIERDDFMLDPPKKFFRLGPGREVRLRSAYYITCKEAITDENEEVTELRCTYDPDTRGGSSPDGRKVKGTLHWVSADRAGDAEVRLYAHLFDAENPEENLTDGGIETAVNPESLVVIDDAKVEEGLGNMPAGSRFQFERTGYFCVDPDSTPEKMVFNRTVTLRDTWAKVKKK